MTTSPPAQRLDFDDIGGALAALRALGLRVSAARRLVLEALFAAERPVAVEQIAGDLRLDPGSVYRNLETFERHGLVRHVHLGHGPGLYVLVGGGEREFIYCERCGEVTALPADKLASVHAVIRRASGYRVRFTHHAIVGECGRCAAPAPEPSSVGAGRTSPPRPRRSG
jgi:Fur family ferric uptake transcriptional regulator